MQDESGVLGANEKETNSRPKEVISDSNSTTCQEDILDQLRLEDDMKIKPQIPLQDR